MSEVEWDGTGESPWLYAKASSGDITVWRCWTQGGVLWVEWGKHGGKLQRKKFDCEPKNPGKANATTAEEQAVKEAAAKFVKQRKKKYFLTPDDALTKLNLKPMLAKGWKDLSARAKSKMTWPVMCQPKLDGRRSFGLRRNGSAGLLSRGGETYIVQHVIDDLEATLPEDAVLDGELYIHGASRQYIGSLITRPRAESVQLEYHVYDVTQLSEQTVRSEHRPNILSQWYAANSQFLDSVKLVETTLAYSEADIIRLHDQWVEQGYEGAIVRLYGGLYRFAHRSGDLLKYKNFEDDEFEIISYTTGKPGSDWDNVPIFRCKMKTGVEFDVAPKGTAAERYQMLLEAPNLIGKMLTVRYQGFTDDGNLDFPVGIEIRGREDMS